jgi:hypothetical protein
MATKKPSAAQIAARKKFSDIMKSGGFAKKRAAKKTVAKKNPAKKAVAKKAVAKKNPARQKNPTILITDTPKKRTVIRRVNPVAKKRVKYTNIAKDMMGELNVGYSVHKQTNPSYMAIAWFTNKKDAISVAQEAADRTGIQMAVSRVQTHFMR